MLCASLTPNPTLNASNDHNDDVLLYTAEYFIIMTSGT
jgi:hypothetical protein